MSRNLIYNSSGCSIVSQSVIENEEILNNTSLLLSNSCSSTNTATNSCTTSTNNSYLKMVGSYNVVEDSNLFLPYDNFSTPKYVNNNFSLNCNNNDISSSVNGFNNSLIENNNSLFAKEECDYNNDYNNNNNNWLNNITIDSQTLNELYDCCKNHSLNRFQDILVDIINQYEENMFIIKYPFIYIGNKLIQLIGNSKLHFKNENNCTLVHLAAKFENIEILEWFLQNCCDENCTLQNHSTNCQNCQNYLWNLKDCHRQTPLFYACQSTSENNNNCWENTKIYKNCDSLIFLLSQPIIKNTQLNNYEDKFGHLPIYYIIKRKDLQKLEILNLFGGQLDLLIGINRESILHLSLREFDFEMFCKILNYAPKLIIKKNQRNENCLFSLLIDFRISQVDIENGTVFNNNNERHYNNNKINRQQQIKDGIFCGNYLRMERLDLLEKILENGFKIVGKELFCKCLLQKNGFGRNLLLESIALNDWEATRIICCFLLENCKGIVKKIVMECDRNGNYFLNLAIENILNRLEILKNFKHLLIQQDLQCINWLLDWLETCKDISILYFFEVKDKNHLTIFDKIKSFDFLFHSLKIRYYQSKEVKGGKVKEKEWDGASVIVSSHKSFHYGKKPPSLSIISSEGETTPRKSAASTSSSILTDRKEEERGLKGLLLNKWRAFKKKRSSVPVKVLQTEKLFVN
ncbi:hypothetical protein ABK040_010631 [Willaertia magna]